MPSRTTLASPTLTKKPTIVPTRALPSFTSVRITWVDQSADDSYQGYACLNALDAEGQPVASVCCTPKVRLWCSITGHLASPDSRKIAYEVKENYTTAENQSGYVAVFVPTGQSWIPIGPIVGPLDISMSLAWNPTSTRLAYQSQHDGNCELYVADLQTRQVVRITDSPGTDDRPNWVSAVRLRYCQERDGQYETYEVDWDGADRHKIGDGCTEER